VKLWQKMVSLGPMLLFLEYLPKNGVKMAFLIQNTAKYFKKWDHNIGIMKSAYF
jgi:hypothetical protein